MEDFYLEKKIYYHDTDCGGVVYYANYLKHLEEARTEFFTGRGVSLKDLTGQGIVFVVARVEIDYKASARYQDTIRILTRIEKQRLSALQFLQRVFREQTLLVEARTILVCVGSDLRPVPIPEEIKKSL